MVVLAPAIAGVGCVIGSIAHFRQPWVPKFRKFILLFELRTEGRNNDIRSFENLRSKLNVNMTNVYNQVLLLFQQHGIIRLHF